MLSVILISAALAGPAQEVLPAQVLTITDVNNHVIATQVQEKEFTDSKTTLAQLDSKSTSRPEPFVESIQVTPINRANYRSPEPSAPETKVDAIKKPELTEKKSIESKPGIKTNTPDNIPPGFESLFQDNRSLVDIYYAGRFVGAFLATFNPESISFENPASIVEKIPNLLTPTEITQAMSGELGTNQEFRCYYQGQGNCGALYPETVGVIFNQDNFRADLFINQSLLAVQQMTKNKYLPASDSKLSFLQTFNYAFAGDDEEFNQEDNLFTTSLLSYRENSIQMVSNYSDDNEESEENFQINTLVAQRDWEGIRYLGGYFQTINEDLRFTSETDLLGFRIGTSLDTREDQRQTSGREIQIFLQSRGEVSIFKDERLINTRIYDAGNQILDTSNLPGGAYDIDIRIRDAGGERVETQFYVKNSSLPPPGEPRYFVELGRVADTQGDTLPETIDLYLLRGSINTRLNFNNTAIAGLSSTEDDSVGEIGWYGLGNHYDILVTAALARHDRYAFNTEARFNFSRAWLTGTYRKIWDDSSEFTDPDDADYGEINLLGEEQEQITAQLNFPIYKANFSSGVRHIDRPESDSVTDYNASIDFELFRTQRSNFRFKLQYNHSDDDDFLVASINWRMSQDHFSYNVQSEYEYNDIDGESDEFGRLIASADWDSRDQMSSDLRAGVSANLDDDFNSYGANADWGGRYGRARGQIEHVDRDQGESTTRHNGNLATSFMVADNTSALGGKEQNQAAVIIDLKGEAEDVFFDVLVDGGRRATARPGRQSVLSLRPFETYKISLKARGDQFVYFNDKEYMVTLYPGNVVKLEWQADHVTIVFGRIKGPSGKPIANALLSGVAGFATTDEYGLFQAELTSSVKTITAETLDGKCVIDIPSYTARRGIAKLGTLQCRDSKKK